MVLVMGMGMGTGMSTNTRISPSSTLVTGKSSSPNGICERMREAETNASAAKSTMATRSA